MKLVRLASVTSGSHSRGRRALPVSAVALVLASLAWTSVSWSADDTSVRLNSIGYLPDMPKIASVVTATGATPWATTFKVKSAAGDVVFSGTLGDAKPEADSNETIQLADFSTVQTPGDYVIEVDNVGGPVSDAGTPIVPKSVTFTIAPTAYDKALATVMLGFYGWRSGAAVKFGYNGYCYQLDAGHLQDALLDFVGSPGVIKDGTGGWYDAGDYGKYTVNGSFAVGMMLQAWEDFEPTLSKMKLFVPESGDSRPDYLDELAYQFKWLLSMQFDDGSVSHKLDSFDFAGFVVPADDTAARYFSKPGSGAAAAFVAATAKGARAFAEADPAFSAKLAAAATKTWTWLQANPANAAATLSDFKNAQYNLRDDNTYRMWAASEYWETTGEAAALTDFETRANKETSKVDTDFDWGNPKNLGMYTYLRSKREGRTATLVTAATTDALKSADTVVANAEKSGYGRGLTNYYWGVNGAVARTCMLLHVADLLKANPRYREVCADQVAHLFGRNPYNRSYVTGVGIKPPKHPHHRPSGGLYQAFPGLLVGGTNKAAADTCSPALCWVDDQENYRTNEVAINWSGALVYALAGLTTGSDVDPTDSSCSPNGGSDAGVKDAGKSGATGQSGSGASGSKSGASGAGTAGASGAATSGASGSGKSGATSGKAGATGDISEVDDPEGTPSKGSGCGCRVPGGPESTGAAWAVGGLAAVLAIVRGRKARRS